MKVTKRARQSRRRLNVRVGLPLIAGAVALGLSGAGQEAMAQDDSGAVMEKLMREVQGTRVVLESCPAELEIYKFVASTDELLWEGGEDGQWADDLAIAVGVTNNGGKPAAFDYALGDCRTREVWVTVKGVQLKPGDKHVGGLRISHSQLHQELGTVSGGFGVKTCVGIFILRQGTKDLFRDGNVPNHDKQYSVAVDYIAG